MKQIASTKTAGVMIMALLAVAGCRNSEPDPVPTTPPTASTTPAGSGTGLTSPATSTAPAGMPGESSLPPANTDTTAQVNESDSSMALSETGVARTSPNRAGRVVPADSPREAVHPPSAGTNQVGSSTTGATASGSAPDTRVRAGDTVERSPAKTVAVQNTVAPRPRAGEHTVDSTLTPGDNVPTRGQEKR